MATVKSKPTPTGKYRGAYIDRYGKQKWFTGTRSKVETKHIALKREDTERQIKLGYRDAPSPAQVNGKRGFVEVAEEYIQWGKTQGGRGGRPWSAGHIRPVQSRLEFWKET